MLCEHALPSHSSFSPSRGPLKPPQPQPGFETSGRIPQHGEISPARSPALSALSLPSLSLACWVLCFSCYK